MLCIRTTTQYAKGVTIPAQAHEAPGKHFLISLELVSIVHGPDFKKIKFQTCTNFLDESSNSQLYPNLKEHYMWAHTGVLLGEWYEIRACVCTYKSPVFRCFT